MAMYIVDALTHAGIPGGLIAPQENGQAVVYDHLDPMQANDVVRVGHIRVHQFGATGAKAGSPPLQITGDLRTVAAEVAAYVAGKREVAPTVRWRAERVVGESERHGRRYAELGRFSTREDARKAIFVDASQGAHALFGQWCVTDMTEGDDGRVTYRPPNAGR